jgi:Sulfate permease and related transporters (MFS superfamily)
VLAITTEYRKGILFVRLEGSLIFTTISLFEQEVNKWLAEGIYNVVFNLSRVDKIDTEGIRSLLSYYKIINKKDGHSLICGTNNHINTNLKKSKILNYIYEISDELNAIKVMKWNSES